MFIAKKLMRGFWAPLPIQRKKNIHTHLIKTNVKVLFKKELLEDERNYEGGSGDLLSENESEESPEAKKLWEEKAKALEKIISNKELY